MHRLHDYNILGASIRNLTGLQETITSINLRLVDLDTGEVLDYNLENPSFMAFDGNYTAGDEGMTADLLDDFVSLGYDLTISADPTPDVNAPRLSLTAEATPEKVLIY